MLRPNTPHCSPGSHMPSKMCNGRRTPSASQQSPHHILRRYRVGRIVLLLLPVLILSSSRPPQKLTAIGLLGLCIYASIFLIPWYSCSGILAHEKSLPAKGWRFEGTQRVFVQHKYGKDLRTLPVVGEDYLPAYRFSSDEYRHGQYVCQPEYCRPTPHPC